MGLTIRPAAAARFRCRAFVGSRPTPENRCTAHSFNIFKHEGSDAERLDYKSSVEYQLTRMGQSVISLLGDLCRWAKAHAAGRALARNRFNSQQERGRATPALRSWRAFALPPSDSG
jgi:hypothetical protein